MITVSPSYAGEHLAAFVIKNHGKSHVCAAVSILVLNTINSIEALTDAKFSYEYKKNGGFVSCTLAEPTHHDASLLLKAMMLGLNSVREVHPDEILIESE